MSPVTHLLVGWVAGAVSGLERRERRLVALAGIAPDLDGLGVVPEVLTRGTSHPLPWFTQYHHALFHNLVFALVVTAAGWALARRRRGLAALMCLVSVHLHFLGDLVGARGPDGYQWPVPYLVPFSVRLLSWSGQWALNSWQNLVITLACVSVCFWYAAARGYSVVEVFSARADQRFTAVVRQRVGISYKL